MKATKITRFQAITLMVFALLSPLAHATVTLNNQFTPATISQGDVSIYSVTFANDDTGAGLTDMLFTLVLQPEITIASPLNIISNTCGFTINQPLAPGASTIELVAGSLAAAEPGNAATCIFEVEVTATEPGNYENTIPASTTPDADTSGFSALSNGAPITNATSASATLSVNPLFPPSGLKVFSPSPAVAGEPVTLTITLRNTNQSSTIPLTTFTDALPDNAGNAMTVDGTPTVSCSGTGAVDGTVSVAPDNQSVTLTGGVIGSGGVCIITVPVVVNAIDGESETFINALDAGAIGNTRGLTSPEFSAALDVETPILLSKSFEPGIVPAGAPVLMTLTVTNRSVGQPLDITSFSDNLAGTTLYVLTTASTPVAAPTDPDVSCTGSGADDGTLTFTADTEDSTITLSDATAGAGGVCTISVWVATGADGPHINTTGTVDNPNNYASTPAMDTLTAISGLTVEKAVTVAAVAPGQWTEFSITINNYSAGEATDVTFQDLLPAPSGFQMVLEDPGSGIFETSDGCLGGIFTGLDSGGADTGLAPMPGDAGLLWTGGTIESGSGSEPGKCTITFRALVPDDAPAGLTFTNEIPAESITAMGPDPITNEEGSGPVDVVSLDPILVAKSFTPSNIPQGGVATLSIVIYNRMLNDLTSINLTDNLPAGLELAANPDPVNGCGGMLQTFPGDNQIILTNGTMGPRPVDQVQSICTITVRVTGSAVGVYTNTIGVNDFSAAEEDIANPATDTLTISPGIAGSKGFAPAGVSSGGVARLTINVSNLSNTQLTNVSIDDAQFGAGLAVANPANAATSCAGSPTLVANPGATSAQMLGGVLNAGASCTFSLDVMTSGDGPWTNTIAGGGITSAEGPSNENEISASLEEIATLDGAIGINKSFLTPIVTGAKPSVLQIDLTNSASFDITGVTFTDTFPPGIVIYSMPDASTTCAGGTVTAIPGDGKVTLSGATLAPTSTCSVFVTTTSLKFLNLTNSIPAGAVSSNEGYTNPLGTIATLATLQGLGVQKSFSPSFMGAGDISRLKFQLTNSFDPNLITTQSLTNVSFTDDLPAGMTLASPPNVTTNCPDAAITADGGGVSVTLVGATIVAGTTCIIEVDVTASVEGVYSNVIPAGIVTSEEGISNNNDASAPLNVVNQPTIAKAFSPNPVIVGEISRLTVTINNSSGAALSGASLSDILPAGLALAASPNAATDCANGVVTANGGASVFAINGASLADGASCTFSADVLANSADAYMNSIPGGALVTDQGLSNPGPADATLDVKPPASVSKAFNPAQIAAGGITTLTITLTNDFSDPITLTAALVDALPGLVLVADSPNIGGTCPGVPGTVTAVAGGTTVTLADGSTIPPGDCTVTVDVTSDTSGSYVNVIAAGQMQTTAGNNQDPAVATLGVDQPAAPTIDKVFEPNTIFVDGSTEPNISTLTISIGNPNTVALTLLSALTDEMPAGLTVDVGLTATTCGGTLISNPDEVGLELGATIPAGGCTITTTVTSPSPGNYNNVIDVDDLVTDAGSPPFPAEAGLVVKTLIPPNVQKAFSPSTINPGGVSTLTITLNNDNADLITLTSALTDDLPTNVTVATTPNIGGTCPGVPGTVTAAAGGSVITYANSSEIPPGACTITVDVTSPLEGGPYTNTIAANALQTDAGNNGAPAVAGLLVNPPQPPSVSKFFTPSPLPKNATGVLTISMRNPNIVPITLGADFIDDLPAGLVIANPNGLLTSTGCIAGSVIATADGTSVTYQAGATIPADGGCAIEVNVTSNTAGTYTNTIGAGDLQTDAGNNVLPDEAEIEFIEWPDDDDIFLEKSIAPGTGFAGSSQEITLTWRNQNTDLPPRNLYQCVVSDPLPDSVFDWSTVAAGDTPAGYTFGYNAATGIVTYTRDDTTTPCENTLQTATFTVNIKADVVTGSTYTNTASAEGQTLPSNEPNVALAETRSTTASDDVVVAAPSTLDKSVTATSKDFTDPGDVNVGANPVVAIGETVTYSLPFTLPPGDSNAIILADYIASGIADVALVSASLARNSTNLSALNDPGGINAALADTPVDVTGLITVDADPISSEDDNEFRLDLGNVTNSDTDSQIYTLVFELRVLNENSNTLSHLITDRSRMYYSDAEANELSVASDPESVHVGLPDITLTKTVDPMAPSAGDIVTYTLTIANVSGTDVVSGFDITYDDTLPTDLISPTPPVFDAGATGATITGSFTGNVLSGTVDQLDPGESVEITYTAQVDLDTPAGKTIVNTASADISTLPDSDPEGPDDERTIESEPATAPFTTATPSITKALLNGQTRYAVGDIAEYRLTVGVPVGVTGNLTVLDTLPAGLAFVNGSAEITIPAGMTGGPSGPTVIVPTDPALTFDLGSFTATSAGNIVIEFQAQVLNLDSNQDGVPLPNAAQASYDDPNNIGERLTASPENPTNIVVGEPNFTMAKTILSGATGSEAGDTVRWQFTVENEGTTIAYQASIGDTLPMGLEGITNIAVTPSGGNVQLNNTGCVSGTTVSVSDATVSTTTSTDDTIAFSGLCFAPGATLTVAFDTTVMNTVTPGENLTNTVSGSYASQPTGSSDSEEVRDGALPGSDDDIDPGNNYNESANNTLMIDAPIAIDKQASKEAATIGETLVYTLTVSLIEGNTPSLVVTDVLPAGLSYVSHTIDVGHVGITPSEADYLDRLGSGQTVQFDFGNVQNDPNAFDDDDFIQIDITVRVDNVTGNQNGVVLNNGEDGTVTVQYGPEPDPTIVPYDYDGTEEGIQGRPLTIEEPVLQTTKTVMPDSQSLGDIVTYTITIEHTAASTSDALNVLLTDTLPAGLDFIAGSVIPANAYVGIVGQVLSLQVDPSDPLTLTKGSTTIGYQARITNAAVVGAPLTNLVVGTYGSILDGNGDADSGRNGEDGSGGLNDYVLSASAEVTPNTDASLYPTKTVAQVTDDNGDSVLDPGERIEYTVVLNNTSGETLTNVLFTDTIPAQTTYVAGSLGTSSGTTDDSAAPTLEVSIPSIDPGSPVTVTFRVEVNAGVPAGTTISNQGSVDSDQTVPTPTDADGVPGNGAQPTDITVGGGPMPASALEAEKLVGLLSDNDGSGTVTQGDTMRYTIVLSNVGASTLTAVSFSDTIPADLVYVLSSAVTSSGAVDVTGQDLSWTGLDPIAAGAFATATFDVTIASVTPDSQLFVNQGTATSDETGDVLTDSNGNPSDGDQPTEFTAQNGGTASPVLDVQKSAAVVIDTAPEGQASPGDTLQYTITVSNTGSAPATDVRFTDPDPYCTPAAAPCTAYIAGSLSTSLGAIVSETPIEVNLGTVDVGGLATITFRVQVDGSVDDGTIVANQGFVTRAGGAAPIPSDDNGDPSDGLNPTLTPISTGPENGVPGSLSKTLVGTSEPDAFSADTTVLIGEVARFQVAVSMPTGTLEQVSLLDTLPEGMSYLPGSATLARVFETGLSASMNPGGVNAAATGAPVPLTDGFDISVAPGPGGTTLLEVFLGNVINSDNDDNAEQYLLEYRVVVQNVDANQDGTTLTNAATVSYWNTLSQPQSLTPESATLTVDEPNISVTKGVSPSALLSTGGTTTYTMTISNAADAATAFNVVMMDPLPDAFTSIGTRTIVSSGATNVVDNSSGTTLELSIDQLDPDGSVTVSFTATAPGPLSDGPIPNTVGATWTSLPGTTGSADDGGVATPGAPGTDTGERTGSGSPTVNDYADSAPAEIQVGTSNITKSLVNAQANYAIGDPVSYRVEVTVPGSAFGSLGNVIVTDILAEGLTYVTGSLAIDYSTASSSSGPSDFDRTDDTPAAGQETLSLSLGTVSNSDTSATTIVLTYQALVDNILDNQAGTSLVNQVAMSFSDPGAGGATATRGPQATTIQVGEPFLTLTKTLTSQAAGLQAGSTASFTVVAGNTGTTTAYETVISDLLPEGLFFPAGSVVTVVTNNLSGNLETPIVTVTADEWSTTAFDLPPGDSVTFTFTVTLADTVEPGDTLQNGVEGSYSSRDDADGNERDGSTDGSVQTDDSDLDNYNDDALSSTITVDDPIAIDKTFTPDPAQNQYQIGDLVSYRLKVSLLVGTTSNLKVIDLLPDGLLYQSSAVGTPAGAPITYTYGGSPTELGQELTFDLGDVVNAAESPVDGINDYLTVDIMARVADVPGNVNGTILGNNARVSFSDPSGQPVVRDFDADAGEPGIQPLDLTVLVPDLEIRKDDGDITASPGETIVYTIYYQNVDDGEATGVVITETVPDHTAFESAASTPGWTCVPDGTAGSTCRLTIGAVAGNSPEESVAFAVTVGLLPAGVTSTDNIVSIMDDMTHGADPTLENNTAPDNTPLAAAPDLFIDKDDGDASGVPGETVVYTLTYGNVGNQDATGVVLTETVPDNTTFDDTADTAGWTCVPDGTAGSVCTLDIGPVAAAAEAVSVEFPVKVDEPLPAGITETINSASIADDGNNGADPDLDNNSNPDTTPLEAAPDLVIVKDDGEATALPGDTVVYTLSYQNVGNQDATGVVLTETVPANTVFNAANSTAGWICTPTDLAGSTCTLDIGDLAAGAAVATANFAVTIVNPLPAGVTEVSNSASIADDGSNGLDPTPENNSDPDTTPITAIPDLVIVKDDGEATAAPGDTVIYTLSYQNVGNQDATGVVLTETVPAYTVFNPANSSAGWICAPNDLAGSTCTLDIGDLAAGAAVATANFAVTIVNPLPSGVVEVSNSASIADDGNNGLDPTPENNSDPDTTPVIAIPDLVIIKDDGGVTAMPGGIVVYSLSYQNVGNQDATGVVLTETVPANTMFDAANSTAGWVCVPDSTPGSTCTLAIGNLAAGAVASVASFAVLVDNPIAAGVEELANGASVADDGNNGPDPTPDNNSNPDTTPVVAVPDMVITKQDSGEIVVPGDTVYYTLTYRNVGNQDATGVVLTETVPVNTSFDAAASDAAWICVPDGTAGSSCTLAIGDVAAGDPAVTVIFAVIIDDPLLVPETNIVNSVSIADDGNNGVDPTPDDNEDDATTQIVTMLNFAVIKDFTDDNPVPVDVHLSCNGGLPLEQDFSITDPDTNGPFPGVGFIVRDFTSGQVNCRVWEEPVPGGYTQVYTATDDNGLGVAGNIYADETGCYFESVETGSFTCTVENQLDPVSVTVNKVWLGDALVNDIPLEASATWTCYNVRDASDGETGTVSGNMEFVGESDSNTITGIYPDFDGSSYCVIAEVDQSSIVESDDSECEVVPVPLGAGTTPGCTIYNTAFFEGIPTLNQYGLLLLALLTLAIGGFGIRRYS